MKTLLTITLAAASLCSAQTVPTVINDTFPNVRAAINTSLTYLDNKHLRGTGAPAATCNSTTNLGVIYVRTDAGAASSSFYSCNKTGSSTYAWELSGGSGGTSPLSIVLTTSDTVNTSGSWTTAGSTACNNPTYFNGTSLTATLPSAIPAETCFLTIGNINASALTVALNGRTLNTGSSNPSLLQGQTMTFVPNPAGTGWLTNVPIVAGSNITLTPGTNGMTIAASSAGTSTGPGVRAYNASSAFSYINGVNLVTFDTIDHDTSSGAIFTAGGSTFTAPSTGTYFVGCGVYSLGYITAAGLDFLITPNGGSPLIYTAFSFQSPTNMSRLYGAQLVYMTSGSTMQCRMAATSSGNLDTGVNFSYGEMYKIGN